MSLVTFAALNGLLATAVLAALAYVCRLPFRIDSSGQTAAAERTAGNVGRGRERRHLPTTAAAYER
jgi:hypothetical protein